MLIDELNEHFGPEATGTLVDLSHRISEKLYEECNYSYAYPPGLILDRICVNPYADRCIGYGRRILNNLHVRSTFAALVEAKMRWTMDSADMLDLKREDEEDDDDFGA